MDELDLNVYHGYRDALRKVRERLAKGEKLFRRLPIILVDYHKWEVFYFEDEYKAKEFLEKNYSSWDDEPPNGEDDDLIVFKFYTEQDTVDYPHSTKDAKLWREINGMKFYRSRSKVYFEPELIINVSI